MDPAISRTSQFISDSSAALARERDAKLEAADALNALHREVYGGDDPLLVEKRAGLAQRYDLRIRGLAEMGSQFEKLMEITDADLTVASCNLRLSRALIPDEMDDGLRSAVFARTASESDFWREVFGEAEGSVAPRTEVFVRSAEADDSLIPFADQALDERTVLAALAGDAVLPQTISSMSEEYAARPTILRRIAECQTLLRGSLGERQDYKWDQLTLIELNRAEKRVRDFMALTPRARGGQILDYLFTWIPEQAYESLTADEQNLLYYARIRDANSAAGDALPMRQGRDARLARLVLKTHERMAQANRAFRADSPERLGDLTDEQALARFCVERFLNQEVIATRDAAYAPFVAAEIRKLTDAFAAIKDVELRDSLREAVGYELKSLHGMDSFFAEHHYLTQKQRRFALSLVLKMRGLFESMSVPIPEGGLSRDSERNLAPAK